MTTHCNKTYEHSQTTRKPTVHNLPKTQSSLSLRPQYPPTYTLPIQSSHILFRKGKMHINCRLLPDHIICKITHINNMGRENTCDPPLKLLNEEISSDIHTHKQNLWKEHLDAHCDHRYNTHIHWKTIHGLSNRAPPPNLNTSITFNNHTQTYCE